MACLFCFYAAALASGAEAEANLKGDLVDLAARVLNFILLVVILVVAVKMAGLKNYFTARTEEIRQRLAELKKGQAEAQEKYRLLEEKLNAFEQQSKKIVEQYRADGLSEKEKILAEAKQKAQQIMAQAEWTIQQEVQAVRERIKADLGKKAAQKAEDFISRGLTDKDQDQLVNEFIERIKKIH
jgi:F-type H+-transporting ATPase subunit b